MKTNTVITYTAAELKDQFPEAFESALEHYRNNYCNEIPWQEEIFDSLKAVCEAADVTLRDWSLGAYNRGNFISVAFPGSYDEEIAELSGKRAFAWLENNLFGPLRFRGNARIDDWGNHNDAAGKFDSRKIDKSAKYYRSRCSTSDNRLKRRHGLPGSIPSCPLTGYCADEDYLEHLSKAIRSGDTLKDAFESLAGVCMRLLESEAEAQATEEAFMENADANEWQFTEDGDLF